MIYRKDDIPDDLQKYFVRAEIGLEATPDAFVAEMVAVFRDVRRVLRDDGTLWLNLGDSYCSTDKWGGGVGGNTGKHTVSETGDVPSWAVRGRKPAYDGIKPKDLIGIPWRVAFALQADGWYLRQDIIWSKPNPMPESVTDRCTKAHEYIFLMSKSARYHYNQDALREIAQDRDFDPANKIERDPGGKIMGSAHNYAPGGSGFGNHPDGRNKRSVWTVATQPFGEAHFATFPPDLIEPCIKAGCPVGGVCLDPFGGAGTTGLVADRLGRDAILIELNKEYAEMAQRRIEGDAGMFAEVQT